jgi:hypothetical protein
MWLLNVIPDAIVLWFINAIIVGGILGLVASYFAFKIPGLTTYKLPIQIVSCALIVIGVYFSGSYTTEKKWLDRVAELESKVAESETKSKVINETIKTVFVDKVQVIKEQQVIVQEKINTVEVKIDSQCKITADTIDILNEAAKGVEK